MKVNQVEGKANGQSDLDKLLAKAMLSFASNIIAERELKSVARTQEFRALCYDEFDAEECQLLEGLANDE